MSDGHDETIRRNCHRLEPIPTDMAARLQPIGGIRAVLFDVYGTLFISGSGDVGTAREAARSDAYLEALDVLGIPWNTAKHGSVDLLFETISEHHRQARAEGIEFPEVDIVQVWRETVRRQIPHLPPTVDYERLALEYEVRVNPVWPMPDLETCLRSLRERGTVMGIVSNAQFYTRELFGALASGDPETLGIDRKLQFYSYAYRRAKPGGHLYRLAADALKARGVNPAEVIYVGNDMLNDILPAAKVGFRTALFAGDKRSLRLREEHLEIRGIEPDIVITGLDQLDKCVVE